jgi:phosphoenolpyruvate carboxykinase (ATP)
VLENVVYDPATGGLDLDDGRHTENTRACYPIEFIPNTSASGIAATPEHRHADADAFGVLPPISRLARAGDITSCRATPRVAGTKGVTQPSNLLDLLRRPSCVIRQSTPRCWARRWSPKREVLAGQYRLVGRQLRGRRAHVDPPHPRQVRAALDGTLATVASSADPHFGMQVPSACLTFRRGAEPKEHLEGQKAYESAARDIARRFEKTSSGSRATSAKVRRRRSALPPEAARPSGGSFGDEPTPYDEPA